MIGMPCSLIMPSRRARDAADRGMKTVFASLQVLLAKRANLDEAAGRGQETGIENAQVALLSLCVDASSMNCVCIRYHYALNQARILTDQAPHFGSI